MGEVGKAAKYMGHEHPRVLRRQDPEPPRPTPKAEKKSKPFKAFGWKYETRELKWRWSIGLGVYEAAGWSEFRWKDNWTWYETEKQRDQALNAWKHQHAHRAEHYRNPTPIERQK